MVHAAFIEFAAVMFVFISDLLDRISLGLQLWGPVLELAARCTLPAREGSEEQFRGGITQTFVIT